MQALHGITGFVYSQVHGWSEDPYRDVASFAGSNGDGLLLYPGDPYGSTEPFPSIRLQVLRDGLEDYESLWLLRERARVALRALGTPDTEALAQGVVDAYGRRLAGSLRAFTRRPEDYYAVRRDLLAELAAPDHLPALVVALADEATPASPGYTLRITAAPGTRVTAAGRKVALDTQGVAHLRLPLSAASVRITAQEGGRRRTVTRWAPWPADPPAPMPEASCPLLEQAPTLDGRLSPGEWAGASVVRTPLLANGVGKSESRAECFLGYDARRLYFAARCPMDARFPAPEEYGAGLILDPPPLGDAKLEMLMTGAGRRFATLKSRLGHTTPRLGWQWAQGVQEGAWVCEMSLAFDTLLPAPTPDIPWAVDCESYQGWQASTWALPLGDIRRLGRLVFTPAARP